MRRSFLAVLLVLSFVPGVLAEPPRTGAAAYGDWHDDAPGVVRHIAPDAMPPPFATPVGGARAVGGRAPRGRNIACPARVRGGRIRLRPRSSAHAKGGAERRRVPGRKRRRPHPRVPRARWRDAAGEHRRVRRRRVAAVRHRVLAARSRPALCLCRRDRTRGALPLPVRRPACARASAGGGAVAGQRRALDAGCRVLPGRATHVRVGRLRHPTPAPRWRRRTRPRRRAWDAAHGLGAAWGDEQDRADVLAFEPEGQGGHVFAAGLRNCVAEAIAPAGGALVVRGERARRAGRQPAAGLCDLGARGRVLRLALVLYRRSSGPSMARRAARPGGAGYGAGRADPAAFGAAGDCVL